MSPDVDVVQVFIRSLENNGGYAIILGFVVVALFWLVRDWVRQQAKRSQEREAETKRLFQNQIEWERLTSDGYRDMAKQSIEAQERVAGVLGETNGVIGQMAHTLERNTDAFNRNTNAFNEFIRSIRGAGRE